MKAAVSFFTGAALVALMPLLAAPAQAQIVQWTGPGSNGHYYQAVATTGTLSWATAAAQVATAGNGGYLATLTSAAENAFVFSLVDSPEYFNLDSANNNQGPYLGGGQTGGPEPAGGWQWITGETWNFTAWHPTQPDNDAGNENHLQFFGGNGNIRQATWNDINVNAASARGYVIEYDTLAVAAAPEPSCLALLTVPMICGVVRRRKRD